MRERRACRVSDADLRKKLHRLASQRRRFRLSWFVHFAAPGGRDDRLQEESAAVSRVSPHGQTTTQPQSCCRYQKAVSGARTAEQAGNLNFGQMTSGRRFRVLNVVDDGTRQCLAALPDTLISWHRVVRELTQLITRRSKPGMIASDNGHELNSNVVLTWCSQIGVE
jgi:putative transposase